jgi:curli biogenesis system outer membrane secretion channel CsgG
MKKNLLQLAASLAVAFAFSSRPAAQDNSPPSLIVAPFGGDAAVIAHWQPALGSGLAEMLITELGKIGKFQVLETTQLETLKDEIKLGEDGWVAASDKVEKGGFAAADFMFTAKVTAFGAKDSKVNLGGFVPGNLGNLGLRQSLSNVRIDWRLVDATNRKILKTGSAAGEHKGVGFDVGVNIGGRGGVIGFDNKEFMDSALGKATVKALSLIIADIGPFTLPESGRKKQKLAQAGQQQAAATAAADALRKTPGKVLAVANKDAIIVSLGSKQGFKDGDKLNLFETVETKDDKGAVVFTEEKLVGEISLQSVQDERSKASYAGTREVKAGWAVKAK